MTLNIYGPDSGGIAKGMKLSFQLYKKLPKRTPYVSVASYLVQTIPGIQEANKVQLEDDSDFSVYVSNVVMYSSISLHLIVPLNYPSVQAMLILMRGQTSDV